MQKDKKKNKRWNYRS